MENVTVTLTRAEYDALVEAVERPRLVETASEQWKGDRYVSTSIPRPYPTLRTADLAAAIDKLEAAGQPRPAAA